MARNDFLRVSVEGAGQRGQLMADYSKLERRTQDRINARMRSLSRRALPVIRAAAPKDSGRLRSGIESRLFFRAHEVRLTFGATAIRDGFDYVAVTRFGHRVAYITPKKKKVLKVSINGRGGRRIFRRSVSGYRPLHDWAQIAAAEAGVVADQEVEGLSRDIDILSLEFAK